MSVNASPVSTSFTSREPNRCIRLRLCTPLPSTATGFTAYGWMRETRSCHTPKIRMSTTQRAVDWSSRPMKAQVTTTANLRVVSATVQ